MAAGASSTVKPGRTCRDGLTASPVRMNRAVTASVCSGECLAGSREHIACRIAGIMIALISAAAVAAGPRAIAAPQVVLGFEADSGAVGYGTERPATTSLGSCRQRDPRHPVAGLGWVHGPRRGNGRANRPAHRPAAAWRPTSVSVTAKPLIGHCNQHKQPTVHLRVANPAERLSGGAGRPNG